LALALPAFAFTSEKYLPDDTNAVIVFNAQNFLESALIKKAGLDKMLAASSQVNKVFKELELDPLKDVQRVLSAGTEGGEDKAVIIFQGKFNRGKFQVKAEEVAKKLENHLKIHKTENGLIYELAQLDQLVQLPPQARAAISLKDKTLYFGLPDDNHLVLTSTRSLTLDILDKAAGKKQTQLKNKGLTPLLQKMDPKETLSVAILPGDSLGTDKIKSITGGLTISENIVLDVVVATADADAAKEINDALKESITAVQGVVGGLVLTQNKALAPLTDILGALKTEAREKDVLLKGTVKGATLEKLFQGLAEQGRKPAPAKEPSEK
jgi:hypothetical protein